MAPKKALFDQPPPQKPEEEEEEVEEESSSEEEEESEVEEEKEKPKNPPIQPSSQLDKKPKATVQKQSAPPTPPQSPSESEEEESSEEESEDEGEKEPKEAPQSPPASDLTIKPITPVKPTSKELKSTSKRASEAQKDDKEDSISNKKVKVGEEELKKQKGSAVSASGGFGRVWNEEDEIGVLQGVIDFQKQKGADPSSDMGAFYDFVKGKLQAEMSKSQIYEKVRRLKKKFFTNVEKGEKGESPVFSKPHESKTFDLSKRIWGGGNGINANGVDENVYAKSNNAKTKKSGKGGGFLGNVEEDERKNAVKDEVKDDEDDFQSKYPFLNQSFDMGSSIFGGQGSFLKENMDLIGNAKARELEGKWKKLREDEAQLLVEKLTMMTEQTKLVLEGMKKR